jgi:transcriptional regulator of acetoin/glycerol metabolism
MTDAAPEAVGPLERSEANAIRAALRRHDGRLGQAARELGVSRTTLWRKMRKYGLRADVTASPTGFQS